MNHRTVSAVAGLCLAAVLCFSGGAWAQTVEVSYGLPASPIPVFGSGAALLMGLILAAVGAFWLHRGAGALRTLAVVVLATGALAATSGGGWLVGNAQAVVATVEYLFSENRSPFTVTEFPAELVNDKNVDTVLAGLEIEGCPTSPGLTGTCRSGFLLEAGGGSCTIESACAPVAETSCGNNVLDSGEEFDPPPGPFSSAPVLGTTCRYDFSSVSQFYCNGSCSISGNSGCDQTEADRFCKIKLDDPDAVATSFGTTTALAEPGFSCANENLGTSIDMTSRGVPEPIAYQDSSILANHGAGTVIVNAVCDVSLPVDNQ